MIRWIGCTVLLQTEMAQPTEDVHRRDGVKRDVFSANPLAFKSLWDGGLSALARGQGQNCSNFHNRYRLVELTTCVGKKKSKQMCCVRSRSLTTSHHKPPPSTGHGPTATRCRRRRRQRLDCVEPGCLCTAVCVGVQLWLQHVLGLQAAGRCEG